MATIPSQRHLFEIPDDVAYFNCAYNSPQLRESTRRLLDGVRTKGHPWERSPASFFEDADTIRRLAAETFGGDADGYAIVPAASYGVSTAARALEPRLAEGDRILITDEEFPSNVLPWKRVARETGASVDTVPVPPDGNWTPQILARLDRRVRVVAVSTCHWTNGALIDVAEIAAACRTLDAALSIDATQTLGAMPFPYDEIQPDFVVAAGYKWLLAPYGFGLLHVGERWRGARPLEEVWLAREHAEDFASLVRPSDTYRPGARRFDAGETCTPTILPGAIAALEQLRAWGVAAIAESLSVVNRRIAAHLERLGFQLPPDERRCPHMFGARLPAGWTGDIVAGLRKQQIHVSQRGRSIRFAPHLHVTDGDVDRLRDALNHMAERGSAQDGHDRTAG